MSDEKIPPHYMACSACNVVLVPVERKPVVSLSGIFSGVLLFAGVGFALLSSLQMGVLIVILALIVGAVGGGKKTVMVCPQCGKEGAAL